MFGLIIQSDIAVDNKQQVHHTDNKHDRFPELIEISVHDMAELENSY